MERRSRSSESARTSETGTPTRPARGPERGIAQPAGFGNLAVARAAGSAMAALEAEGPPASAARAARASACSCSPGMPPCPGCRAAALVPFTRAAPSGGRPLEDGVRAELERKLGHDLGSVRVHAGAEAARAADRLDAAAFTWGQDIVFGPGQYRPQMPAGRRLLAHEVAHTVQQRGGPPVIQRQDKAAAAAQAQIAPLEEASCPKPAADAHDFLIGPPRGTIKLSSSPTHSRREVALLIGDIGLEKAEEAVKVVERQSEAMGGSYRAMGTRMRQDFTGLKAAWVKFSADTRQAATARLIMNDAALGEWSTYVASMAPVTAMDQLLAAQELKFLESLARRADPGNGAGMTVGPYNMLELAERRAWSTSPGRRGWVEMINNGQIKGGCMDCHVQKSIKDYDASFAPNDLARTAPVFRFAEAAERSASAEPGLGPRIMDTPVPAMEPGEPIWNMVQGQPGLSSISASLQQIATRLMPLVEQYKVVPLRILNRPFTPESLVAAVQMLIADRRQGYRDLQGKLAKEDYDFLQLLPLVETFLGTVGPDERQMIKVAQQRSAAAQAAKRDALTGLGILAMLLTIFPPTAPLGIALGMAVATVGLHQGYLDYMQGRQFMQGTGAQVFSPEQEAAAGALMAGGIMSMALNAFSLLSTGAAAGRALFKPAAPPVEGATYAWTITNFNKQSGVITAVGKNLTPGSAGEMVTAQINVRTGMGIATLHGPNGGSVPIVNGRLQFSAGLLPEAGGSAGAMVKVGPGGLVPGGGAAPAAPPAVTPPGAMVLPPGQSASFIRGYLMAGDESGAAGAAVRPQYGSRVILPSDAPRAGEAPAFQLGLGPQGQGGTRLMNRGLRPSDYGNSGYRGNMIADDPVHLQLWTEAEAKIARSTQDNIYKQWLAAVRDGTVVNWSNADLHRVYKMLWDEYKELARAQGIDVATLHHWNYNKNLYPTEVVDPRNLFVVYGQQEMIGGHHPFHQGGLHVQTSSGHPTRSPIAPIHAQQLQNANLPLPNPDFPGMPYGWHPPMLPPDPPFGWDPLRPPEWPNWPGGTPPTRPPM